jgi:hypothetical protein
MCDTVERFGVVVLHSIRFVMYQLEGQGLGGPMTP